MTNREINKCNMFNAVLSVFKRYEKVILNTKALTMYYNELEKLIEQIILTDQQYINSIIGKTLSKSSAAKELIDLLIPIKSAVYAYALDNNNPELSDILSKKNYNIKKMRTTELILWSNSVLSLLIRNNIDYSDYGVTKEMLNDLKKVISLYSELNDEKDNSFNNRKNLRQELTNLFIKADELFKKIDNLMLLQKNSSPDFYAAYNTSSVIKDLGVGRKTKNKKNNMTKEKEIEFEN